MKDLSVTRKELDVIDNQMKELFQKRLKLMEDVVEYKMEVGKPIFDGERERQKLSSVTEDVEGAFTKQALTELFCQMMAIGRKLQYQILCERGKAAEYSFTSITKLQTDGVQIVYQGVEGAYSHAASLQVFGQEAQVRSVATFEAAMEEVAEGRADYAVLPIENSRAGAVGDVYDLLMKYDNTIVAETYLRVEHCLLALPGTSFSNIRTVYSHPQGLMQCAGFMEKHREIQQVSQSNTAVSARKVVEDGDASCGAIASELAGSLYGLEVLERGISDDKNNTTRFIIVQKKKEYLADAQKISICIETEHVSGALYNQLSHFIFNGLNMTKIESRPIPDRAWEYRFYIDFEGNLSRPEVENALFGLEKEASRLKILGNYSTRE